MSAGDPLNRQGIEHGHLMMRRVKVMTMRTMMTRMRTEEDDNEDELKTEEVDANNLLRKANHAGGSRRTKAQETRVPEIHHQCYTFIFFTALSQLLTAFDKH